MVHKNCTSNLLAKKKHTMSPTTKVSDGDGLVHSSKQYTGYREKLTVVPEVSNTVDFSPKTSKYCSKQAAWCVDRYCLVLWFQLFIRTLLEGPERIFSATPENTPVVD